MTARKPAKSLGAAERRRIYSMPSSLVVGGGEGRGVSGLAEAGQELRRFLE